MANPISIKTNLSLNLTKVAHEARPLFFHGRIRANFISAVAACENEGRGGEGADGLGDQNNFQALIWVRRKPFACNSNAALPFTIEN